MKKLLAILALVFLLTGCTATNQQSYLDEKIKCKKLADARIAEIRSLNIGISSTKKKQVSYSSKFDSCFLYYQKTYLNYDGYHGMDDQKIENLLTGEEVAWTSADEVSENFKEKLKLYFGEDTE